MVDISNTGGAAFLGQLPSQYPPPWPIDTNGIWSGACIATGSGYADIFPGVAPINDANDLDFGYLCWHGNSGLYPYLDWNGLSTVSITSIPDPNDISTWTWTEEYYASGTSLGVTDVPEPTAISIAALAAILGITSIFCKSRKTDRLSANTTPEPIAGEYDNTKR
jgi:hypothetical protein